MGKINIKYSDGNIGGVIASQDGVSGYIHFNNVLANQFPSLPKVVRLRQARDLNKYGIYGTPQELIDNGSVAADATAYGVTITASSVSTVVTLEFNSPVSGKEIKVMSTLGKMKEAILAEAKNDYIQYYNVREFLGMSTLADVLDAYYVFTYDSGDVEFTMTTTQPAFQGIFGTLSFTCAGGTLSSTSCGDFDICQVYQNIADYFAQSPDSVLYFSLISGNGLQDATDAIDEIVKASDGQVRQVAYVSGTTPVTDYIASFIGGIQTHLESLATDKKPLVAIVGDAMAYKRSNSISNVNLRSYSAKRVSGVLTTLPHTFQYSATTSHTVMGEVLGLISKNKVSDSIAWVGNNPMLYGEYDVNTATSVVTYSWEAAGEIATDDIDAFQANGWILPMSYVGNSARFINADNNSAAALSDYNSIKRVRTMDKVARLAYQALVPFISSPLYVDKATGFLSEMTVQKFETVISQQLDTMENAYELSGYSVEIPEDQNILQTATLDVNVKVVPVGSADVINVNLAYAVQI